MLSLQVFFVVITMTAAFAGKAKREVYQSSYVSSSSGSSGSGGTYTSGFAASTGPDGKLYYVKNVNGKVEKGVIEGKLPTLDMNGIYASAMGPLRNDFIYNPFTSSQRLNEQIRQSVSQYLQNMAGLW